MYVDESSGKVLHRFRFRRWIDSQFGLARSQEAWTNFEAQETRKRIVPRNTGVTLVSLPLLNDITTCDCDGNELNEPRAAISSMFWIFHQIQCANRQCSNETSHLQIFLCPLWLFNQIVTSWFNSQNIIFVCSIFAYNRRLEWQFDKRYARYERTNSHRTKHLPTKQAEMK